MQQWEGKEGENALGKEFRDSQLFLLRWHWIKNSREVVTSSWVKRFKRKNQQQPPGQFYPVNIVEKKMYARFLFFLSPPPPFFFLSPNKEICACYWNKGNTLPTDPGGSEPLSGRRHPRPPIPGSESCPSAWSPSPHFTGDCFQNMDFLNKRGSIFLTDEWSKMRFRVRTIRNCN